MSDCNVLAIEGTGGQYITLLQWRKNQSVIKKEKKGHCRHCIIHVDNIIIIAKYEKKLFFSLCHFSNGLT